MGPGMQNMFRQVATALIALVLMTSGAAAQTYQGSVRGNVHDAQGVIPGVEVTLTNEATNAARTVVSNEVGEYAFASVLPGTYTVKVVLPGFRTEERRGLRVGTQQSLVQDFALSIGQLEEQVTVTGASPLVERSSATVASSLDKTALEATPI